MGTHRIGLQDVEQGARASRWRLLAPLRYLAINNAEKARYDFQVPLALAAFLCIGYYLIDPKPSIFRDGGLLEVARDFLVMAVPFMVGALAAVAMGSPGSHLDRRPVGTELYLDGELLTLRQFVCYLLGYLCFVSIMTLLLVVGIDLLHEPIRTWTASYISLRIGIEVVAATVFALLFSSLLVTTLWSLYFLTDVVNRKHGQDGS